MPLTFLCNLKSCYNNILFNKREGNKYIGEKALGKLLLMKRSRNFAGRNLIYKFSMNCEISSMDNN